MGAGVRWVTAIAVALGLFGACWGGLAAEAPSVDMGTDVGLASVPLAVALTVLGPWADRARKERKTRRVGARAGELWQVPQVPGWVDRAELAEVISALTAAGGGAVSVTTGLAGAGGFGKTMLAARACRDKAVQRRFGGGIVWVTVGRDLSGGRLAARIGEVIAELGEDAPLFVSAEQAGGALADRGRVLLVADDVWTVEQLEAFSAAGQVAQLLVTTRRPGLLAGYPVRRITVDAVGEQVARRLLCRGLPGMAGRLERELLAVTGRWPLLLSLVNRRLVDDVNRGAPVDAAAAEAAGRLRRGGPAALDVTDSGSRQTAVAATIGYSLDTLATADRERFYELGIFAEDAEVPLEVAGLLWSATAVLDLDAAVVLCERLDGLSLLTLAWAGQQRMLVVHDVIREFAAGFLGAAGRRDVHAALAGAAGRAAGPDGGGRAPAAADDGSAGAAWWRLPESPWSGYLWQYLTYHLQQAGMTAELDRVCCDLRFLAVRLRRSGRRRSRLTWAARRRRQLSSCAAWWRRMPTCSARPSRRPHSRPFSPAVWVPSRKPSVSCPHCGPICAPGQHGQAGCRRTRPQTR